MVDGAVAFPAEEQVHCWIPSGVVLERSNSSQRDCPTTVKFGEKNPTKPDINNENRLSLNAFFLHTNLGMWI